MPLYRHFAILLDQSVPGDQPLSSQLFRVHPVDSDPTPDSQQTWRAAVTLMADTAGTVRLRLQTSFDKVNWLQVAQASVGGETPSLVSLLTVANFGPYLRVQTTPIGLDGQPPPLYRASLRLVSDAPFRVSPE